MPRYHVRLRCGPKHAWLVDVPVRPYERLSDCEIQRRARALAVKAFGRRARRWPLIDYYRGR